jgi:hypothetical protein
MTMNADVSIENVAYALLIHVAFAEQKAIATGDAGDRPSKEWILQTYADCLRAVRQPKPVGQI